MARFSGAPAMITVIEFDFSAKRDRAIDASDVPASRAKGLYCWADADGADPAAVEALLKAAGVNDLAVREVLGHDREGRFDVYDDCLHFAATETRLDAGQLAASHIDVVLAAGLMVTYHRKDAECIRQMKRTYRDDFIRFSRSPSFLLYEFGGHLIECHRATLGAYAEQVEQAQLRLFGQIDDDIFRSVAALTSDLLSFRKIMTAARELFHEMAARKSAFISETSLPYIERMAGKMERLGHDLSAEREILTETLNLYMGMVSHRINRVINRLTVISMIFLPLSFLCGVYGMNLKNIPEMDWEYGYAFFWAAALVIAGGLFVFMKRRKWL
jgi:magnesium transporter